MTTCPFYSVLIYKVDWEVGQKSYCLTIQRLYVMLYAIWYYLFDLKKHEKHPRMSV